MRSETSPLGGASSEDGENEVIMMTEIQMIVALVMIGLAMLGVAKKTPLFGKPDDDKGQPISWLKIPVGEFIHIRLEQVAFALIADWRQHGYHLPERADDLDMAAKVSVRSKVKYSSPFADGIRGLDFLALQGALVIQLLRMAFEQGWTLGGDDGADVYAVPDGFVLKIEHVEASGARTRYVATIAEGGA